ncbi:MAG TPA: ISNCY family transposase [Prolixibacteraceae bacterium]|nr:ISNCY family transposase [Prolixibacteraceae bacterium]
MRTRFEQQFSIGHRLIEETPINAKRTGKLEELIAAMKAIYCHPEYNQKIFNVLESHLTRDKKQTGRKGMDLWCIFVLSQVRLCLNTSYEWIHNLANNHLSIRWLMGIETEYGFKRVEFSYQNIYDNVTLISDEMVKEINAIVLEFGHGEVFKKKETEALRLKTDSFVVESNVHFPTDYNLLWDCARKCIDMVYKFLDKHDDIEGWRKIKNWRAELKGLMRELGKASSSGGKGKEQRVKQAAARYISKSRAFYSKVGKALPCFPIFDEHDLGLVISMEYFMQLLQKHIDLVDRRIIKGETIPHEEKMFSIFETYTEWIKKGKSRPNVELGKKLSVTTDQYNLIVDYQIMDHQQDRDIAIALADRLLSIYKIQSWSFDKGYWGKDNKQLLQTEVPEVIMPKLGKRNKKEEQEETSRPFKRLKNGHSAIESNINELENRGLDRCPDKGEKNFTRYIALGVCAYNLKKIGAKILKDKREELRQQENQRRAA